MGKRKDIFTTGQVAAICNVAPRTVTKWFDSGQLRGYRIPGSRDRRIPVSELIRFMRAHDIPTDSLDMGIIRVMIVDADWEMASVLQKAMETLDTYDVRTTEGTFEAGLTAQKFKPHVVLINLLSKEIDADALCKGFRASEDLQGTKVIAIADKLGDNEVNALLEKGFDAVITDPGDLNQVKKRIDEAIAIIY
ncbi:MAG: helix-turn-helix domain-containing protein [Planctomycetota bacterium]